MFWKLNGVTADRPHIIVAHGRRPRLVGIAIHRTRTLEAGDVVRRGPFRVTSVPRTLIDLAGVLTIEELEEAVDDALRRRLTSVPVVVERVSRSGMKGVAGIGKLRRLLEDRVGGRVSGSALESRFRRRLLAAGLPIPVAQHEIKDDSGRLIARVDFAYPHVLLALEVDGYAHHSGRRKWESDLARQNRLISAGWRLLRFSSADVDSPATILAVERALASGDGNPKNLVVSVPRKSKNAARS
jgi:very-short-patch-repair endonuclease